MLSKRAGSKRDASHLDGNSWPKKTATSRLATQAIFVALGKSHLFSIDSLFALSQTSKELSAAAREDHVWRPLIKSKHLGFSFRHDADDSSWPNKFIPTRSTSIDARGVSGGLLVPPRQRGRRRDHDSWFPHPQDELPLSRDLVLDLGDICCCRITRFNQVTGAVEDLFHPAESPVGPEGVGAFREEIYLPRPLPVTCVACDHVSSTYADFVEHIKTLAHIRLAFSNFDDTPPEWTDPRYLPSFDFLSSFEQVKALLGFKAKVLAKLREPLSRVARRNMKRHLDWMDPPTDLSDRKALRLLCEFCVEEFPINDFKNKGVRGYCLEILSEGWDCFEPHGSGSEEAIFFGAFDRF